MTRKLCACCSAEPSYEKVLELDPDAGPDVAIELVRIDILQGRYSQAYESTSALPEGKFRDYGLALLHEVPDHQAESDAAFERLVAQRGDISEGTGQDILDDIMLAEVQAYRGRRDDAFDTFTRKKKAVAQKWGTELPVLWYLQHEAQLAPFLIPLHGNPRWREFVSEPGADSG